MNTPAICRRLNTVLGLIYHKLSPTRSLTTHVNYQRLFYHLFYFYIFVTVQPLSVHTCNLNLASIPVQGLNKNKIPRNYPSNTHLERLTSFYILVDHSFYYNPSSDIHMTHTCSTTWLGLTDMFLTCCSSITQVKTMKSFFFNIFFAHSSY